MYLQIPPAPYCCVYNANRRTEQSMLVRVFLFPNSMTLSVYLCRHVASALLLLFLCSSTSCLESKYEDCFYRHTCGVFEFGYPFGKINSGCGVPEFQLDCDPFGFPLLNIGGNEYHISEPYLLSIDSKHSMTIINGNIWVSIKKCNLSGNYTQSWQSGSRFFHMVDGYTNLTLWRGCNPFPNPFPKSAPLNLEICGDVWYYSFIPEFDLQGARFCTNQLHVPISKKNLSLLSINPTLLLQGFEITWQVDENKEKSCGACLKSKGVCGYNISEPATFLCYCPDGTSPSGTCSSDVPEPTSDGSNAAAPQTISHGGHTKKSIVIGCSVGFALIAIALVLFLRFYAKRRKTPGTSLGKNFRKYERMDMKTVVLHRAKKGNSLIFSYEELRHATNCFHEENEIGDGGYGSVYLGKLLDGRTVAVKRLHQDNSRRLQQFINEVKIFSSLNHPRVVRLYGSTSEDSPELLLVYEFVSNGTLADHLHGDRRAPKGLPWDTRLKIAIQTAEALAFLHNVDPPIFHRDVKSTNILLDENFNVKLADFGLCRLVPVDASHVTTAPQGTPGYVDPEYHQCYQLTEKSDVYSFGVVLVEIISAKLAVDINRNRREISLAIMAISKIQEGALHELLDPQLEVENNDQVKVMVSAVAELVFRCLASERDERPHMKEIVAQLEQIRGACPSPGEHWGSFPSIKHPLSPTSVQDKWTSTSSNSINSE